MKTRVTLILLFIIVGIHANWIENLFNPHISYWDPIDTSVDAFQNLTGIGFNNYDGYIAAYGDFNSDKYTDIFVVRKADQPSIDVLELYIWSPGSSSIPSQFQAQDDLEVAMNTISNVIPSDFNADGRLDVLLQGTTLQGNMTVPTTVIWFGNGISLPSNLTIDNVSATHLLLLDANDDLKVDLFGTDNNGTATLWINNGSGNFTSQPFAPALQYPIAAPHSNAFVDINGDCLSDLVVVTQDTNNLVLEVFINLPETDFIAADVIPLPVGAGQISWADIDRDGTMDFVFPVCDPQPTCATTNAIYIGYNAQLQMCTSITGGGDGCLDSEDVCNGTAYTLPDFSELDSSGIVVVESLGNNTLFFNYTNPSMPNTLNVGDYNKDGFPDIAVVVRAANTDITKVELWSNAACTSALCSVNATNVSRRTFQWDSQSGANIESQVNAYAASFFDVYEDGTLDIFILTDESISASGSSKAIATFQNLIDFETYFMKALGLSGICSAWCSEGPRFPSPKPVGVNQPGAVFKYLWTDNNSDKKVAAGGQLTQSAYLSLQLPYVYFGLGDSGNYVQQIYFGVPINPKSGKHFQYFPDVLPNSQVAYFPSPPDRPYFWSMEEYMRPSGMTFYTMLACFFTCFALACAAMAFGYREKQVDKQEAEENRIHFTF